MDCQVAISAAKHWRIPLCQRPRDLGSAAFLSAHSFHATWFSARCAARLRRRRRLSQLLPCFRLGAPPQCQARDGQTMSSRFRCTLNRPCWEKKIERRFLVGRCAVASKHLGRQAPVHHSEAVANLAARPASLRTTQAWSRFAPSSRSPRSTRIRRPFTILIFTALCQATRS